ncbi:fumarate hydratase [uncultured Mucilaginibacter sp.]|uniref:fumarate hydratase n=1 Tax=uncultured Mucilaginibacter sp. TaxID=797541 RepID=UPI0025E4D58A|nr:fumarate hydratase [uncultured Mucilaginibacter sp.]
MNFKKAFCFKLSALSFQKAFCFLLLALCSFSCSFNPSLQGKGEAAIQGTWQQDSLANSKQLVNYALYGFRFSCDSVFIRMENFSKVNYGADTCMRNGHWFEYARATYTQSHDTLRINGYYCNADYTLKVTAGCFNTGPYAESFKISPKGDSVLQLQPLSGTLPFKLKLIKRTSCVPKPL